MAKFGKIAAIASMVAMLPLMAAAQNLKPVNASKDWAVYVNDAGTQCYIVSTPKSSAAYRDGNKVDVNRGDIRMYIGVIKGATEPSFLAGYPLDANRAVEVKIGGNTFNYFVNPDANAEFAWPLPDQDSKLIAAMKGGIEAEVTGVSARGTQTVDKFSLSGFTAALADAVKRCS